MLEIIPFVDGEALLLIFLGKRGKWFILEQIARVVFGWSVDVIRRKLLFNSMTTDNKYNVEKCSEVFILDQLKALSVIDIEATHTFLISLPSLDLFIKSYSRRLSLFTRLYDTVHRLQWGAGTIQGGGVPGSGSGSGGGVGGKFNKGSTKGKRTLTSADKKYVASLQEWKCAWCKQSLPARFEVDHIVQFADGGSDEVSNLQALCPNCHSDKTEHDRQAQLAIERDKETLRQNPWEDDTDDINKASTFKPIKSTNFSMKPATFAAKPSTTSKPKTDLGSKWPSSPSNNQWLDLAGSQNEDDIKDPFDAMDTEPQRFNRYAQMDDGGDGDEDEDVLNYDPFHVNKSESEFQPMATDPDDDRNDPQPKKKTSLVDSSPKFTKMTAPLSSGSKITSPAPKTPSLTPPKIEPKAPSLTLPKATISSNPKKSEDPDAPMIIISADDLDFPSPDPNLNKRPLPELKGSLDSIQPPKKSRLSDPDNKPQLPDKPLMKRRNSSSSTLSTSAGADEPQQAHKKQKLSHPNDPDDEPKSISPANTKITLPPDPKPTPNKGLGLGLALGALGPSSKVDGLDKADQAGSDQPSKRPLTRAQFKKQFGDDVPPDALADPGPKKKKAAGPTALNKDGELVPRSKYFVPKDAPKQAYLTNLKKRQEASRAGVQDDEEARLPSTVNNSIFSPDKFKSKFRYS